MESPLDLEYYPEAPLKELEKAKRSIESNKSHWDPPFFMDVYKYADIKEFREVCKPFLSDPKLENIIILGSGGSYQSMKGLSLLSKKRIYFLTSSRPFELNNVINATNPKNSLVIPISRAGNTLDINAVISLFKDYKFLAISSQGWMFDLVKKLNATTIPVPDLSGRFAAAVCSVALVPALLAGIDIDSFQKGQSDGYSVFKNLDKPSENSALKYATFLNRLSEKGYRNIFSMPYSEWLEGLVGLFVQEISESSGKDQKGLLGTMQAAPLCQHSVLELLLGGSKGHTSPLIWTAQAEPIDLDLKSSESLLKGQTGLSIINYQADASFQALLEQNIPCAKINLKSINAYSLGFLVSFIQTVVYFYCLIINVNWSSNPMVNIGKKICIEAIKNNLDPQARLKSRIQVVNTQFVDFWK